MVTGNTRSQDQAQAYHPIGTIYDRLVNDFSGAAVITLYPDPASYLMDRSHFVDIDSEMDFLIASAIAESGWVE